MTSTPNATPFMVCSNDSSEQYTRYMYLSDGGKCVPLLCFDSPVECTFIHQNSYALSFSGIDPVITGLTAALRQRSYNAAQLGSVDKHFYFHIPSSRIQLHS